MTPRPSRQEDPPQDKRSHFRKPMRRSVEVVLGDGARTFGVCMNLSLGGMQIEAAELGAIGAQVTIYMELEGIDGQTAIPGVVRWTKPGVMGIQFDLYGVRITYALLRMLPGPHLAL